MSLFLTGDYHLGHFNVLEYCSRPFTTLEQHDNHIIKMHNERIGDNDFYYHNGDFNFRNSPHGKEGVPTKGSDYAKRLNGRGLFILGNHERHNSRLTYISAAVIDWGGNKYWITHRPQDANKDYPINFVSHVHGEWKFQRRRIDDRTVDLINVGIDVNDYMPKKIEELLSEYQMWKKGEKHVM